MIFPGSSITVTGTKLVILFPYHTGFPKFKSKHRDKSVFKNVNSVRFDFKNNRVKIPIRRFEPSSKMCGCGYIHRDLKLSDRVWTCPECGAVNDRDLLAANNIKKFGLEKQNLITQENINKTPVVNRVGDVESLALAGTLKRQNILV